MNLNLCMFLCFGQTISCHLCLFDVSTDSSVLPAQRKCYCCSKEPWLTGTWGSWK
jgi:hypothetical protein